MVPSHDQYPAGPAGYVGGPAGWPPAPPPPPRRGNPGVIVLVVACVLLLAVLGALVWQLTSRQSSTDSLQSADSSAVTITSANELTLASPSVIEQPPAPFYGDSGPTNGEQIVWTQRFGTARANMYLSNSGYNRIEVISSGGRAGNAAIWSSQSGWRMSPNYESAARQFSSPPVYAPGDTCVRIVVTYAGETLNRKIC